MKHSSIVVLAVSTLWLGVGFAGIPPEYLSVPKWQVCTDTYHKKGAEFVCLPDFRPAGCPKSSWKRLKWGGMVKHCPNHYDNYDNYDNGNGNGNGNGNNGLGSAPPQ